MTDAKTLTVITDDCEYTIQAETWIVDPQTGQLDIATATEQVASFAGPKWVAIMHADVVIEPPASAE